MKKINIKGSKEKMELERGGIIVVQEDNNQRRFLVIEEDDCSDLRLLNLDSFVLVDDYIDLEDFEDAIRALKEEYTLDEPKFYFISKDFVDEELCLPDDIPSEDIISMEV